MGNNYVQQKINHITSDIRMQVDLCETTEQTQKYSYYTERQTKDPRKGNTLQNVQPNSSKTNLSLNKELVRLSPPVFIQADIVYSLIEVLNKSVRDTYNLKTTNQEIKIQASVMNTYRQIIRTLKTRNANNYTFQLKEERRYKAKIKGLHYTTSTTQIKQELHLHGHTALYNICTDKNTLWRTIKNLKRANKHSLNLGYQYQLEIIPLNTTFKEVKDLISKLNPKKVSEVNLITGKLLQLPHKATWKCAKVILILKLGKPILANYKPICLFPTMSKILGK
ncbi:hypothetical protein HZH68_009190 [Vespula germanica]|uniref:Uncharacterized protein n=1 Tax=Vespula germanica TaxID=30212 RepID=A0A834N884_VESGE|nr:hypothetical protein HZH68_009190 [Vespula germanica]